MKNLKGFTFVELVVSMFISSILLGSVFYFISANVEDIFLSNQKIEFYASVNDFRNELLNITSVYSSGTVIYNNAIGSGSDALLLESKIKGDGYLVGVIYQGKILIGYNAYNAYGDKTLGYAKVSSGQIASFYANSLNLNQVTFDDSHIFAPLKIRDFQVDLYNSGSIINLDLTLLHNYVSSLDGISRSNPILKGTSFLKINLDF